MGHSPAEGSGYNGLMQEVCVGHGWCGGIVDGEPSHVDDFIPENGPVSSDQFVDWLFTADGVDPVEERERWARQRTELKAAYVQYMGADVVDASLLKWAV
mgnify:CR=1 FL=1